MKRLWQKIWRWFQSLKETGETCPHCGGPIVFTLDWIGETRFCRQCRAELPEDDWKK